MMLAPALTPREIAEVISDEARLHRFTVPRFLRMMEQGFFSDDVNIELLEGWIVEKMAGNPPHAATQRRVSHWLNRVVPDGWIVDVEQLAIMSDSVPQPDVSVVRGDIATYDHRHPVAEEIGLLIEIADSTVAKDRRKKRAIYAASGIAQMWLIDVPARLIEVCTQPNVSERIFASVVAYSADQPITLVLDGQPIASTGVASLLPTPE